MFLYQILRITRREKLLALRYARWQGDDDIKTLQRQLCTIRGIIRDLMIIAKRQAVEQAQDIIDLANEGRM